MEKDGLELEITELRLGLPGRDLTEKIMKKRGFMEMIMTSSGSNSEQCESGTVSSGVDVEKVNDMPAGKTQVVGWPPVCSYRRKNSCKEVSTTKVGLGYVKVSMDGIPYLRKMDLGSSQGYDDLAFALDKLFHGIGVALKDGDNCEYVTIYEDKDGDWMLAGDVPWVMFIESCKRLRIMKRSDATGFGLQPRGVDE
ncbi:Auxin-responsive protein IAA19 [Raphanus sativus]|uniref:Auxin-responsive protein n=1 Tax=Raphanus sativus TaxID=3726 RepID=A0A6J0JQE2_RAPSA|nr:auxin-responsive protein IAA19 [Raphanus sativus]XP_056854098.1 auxin-responsive protein IAA19-like [Raphanus sativus]KAJ4870531.1 Auxin-responsive protein IAA19 [Raphanus sativus]KAJ4886545.1 Auxin-responsive protein IAA19 [Raphanus sativus]